MNETNIEKEVDKLLAQGILYELLPDVEPEFTEQDNLNLRKRLQEAERRKQKIRMTRTVYRTGIAACFLLLFVALSFPNQVQAVAQRVYEMVQVVFSTHTDLHWEKDIETATDVPLYKFSFGYFPEELKLVNEEGNPAGVFKDYKGKEGVYLYFSQMTASSGISIDSEDAEVDKYEVAGVQYLEYRKRGETQIIWETNGNIFHIHSNMDPDILRKIALGIKVTREVK